MEKEKPQQMIVKEKGDLGVVRILSKDIEGKLPVYVGLTKIKGISWSISNATCALLHIPKNKKIGELTQEEIKKIAQFSEEPERHLPSYVLNRRNDRETGVTSHIFGSDLDLKKEFDIKRLKKIHAYRGVRHVLGQPTRGQRTRSHFRKKGRKAVGVQKRAGVKAK